MPSQVIVSSEADVDGSMPSEASLVYSPECDVVTAMPSEATLPLVSSDMEQPPEQETGTS